MSYLINMNSNAMSKALKTTASSAAILVAAAWAGPALAQDGAGSGEVVVTGSRVVRDGFQAPTPLTVMSTEQIQSSGVKDISEFVTQLPAVSGSQTLATNSRFPAGTTGGGAGLAVPSLRGMGTQRTLVLLDGQRAVASNEFGDVDTGNFPQQLVSRIEVVTGGASAAYGSDAVAGVINYVLDKSFTGFKSETSYGVSDYGDAKNWRVSLAGGTRFADDRGHLMVSVDKYHSDGVFGTDDGAPPSRKWLYNPGVVLENPAYTTTNGQPFYIIRPDLASAQGIKGALVNTGPLRWTAFGDGGQVFSITPGLVVGGRMSGGDWQASEVSSMSTLDPILDREGVFGRVSYDLTSNLNVYAQAMWNHTDTASAFCCTLATPVTINVNDNPFLPASVRTRAQALGQTTLTVGSFLDHNKLVATAERWVQRYVLGASGDFNLIGSDWSWDAYYQYGHARETGKHLGHYIVTNFSRAIDAVVNPATGATVCRVTLANPSDPCKPYNILGWGMASDAANNYVGITGNGSWRHVQFEQNVYAFSVNGEPLSTWAGPVSLAFGAEHREDEAGGVGDPISANAGWLATNFRPTIGKIDVTEGFVETVVPLLTDQTFARSLEFNGAVRRTHYSEAGDVTTWKAGLTWSPIDDIRFRATRSRDIRAPNISDTFATGTLMRLNINDPFTNQFGISYSALTRGNPDLVPEEADTTGIGVVFQPTFLPGFSFSADYYKIDLEGAIQVPGNDQQTVDQCFAGRTEFCANILRDGSGNISFVLRQPINFVKRVNEGVDYEASYRFPLEQFFAGAPGDISLRWVATNFQKSFSDDGIAPARNLVGEGALRRWRNTFTATFTTAPFTASLTARAISDGVNNTLWIECASGCPTSTLDARTIEPGGNFRPGYLQYDAAFSYRPTTATELFASIRNLENEDPPRIPGLSNQGTRGNRGTDDGVYDMIGRAYRVGLRARF